MKRSDRNTVNCASARFSCGCAAARLHSRKLAASATRHRLARGSPPCLLPCCYVDGKTADAHFAFTVANQYNRPRTFEFSSGQQFYVGVVDQTGRVVAAWSDGRPFTQALTSFTLDPGRAKTFADAIPLKDRDGQQLNGRYFLHAFLTTSGSLPRVEAATGISVIVVYPP